MLESIERLYRTRFSDFLRVATATAGSSELGRDAVQEAFVTAIRGRHGYRGEGTVEAWLWRVVVTSALKAWRSNSGTRVIQAPSEEPPIGSTADDFHDDLHELRKILAQLPERQRMVLFLRYYADLDYQTIAHVLDVQPGTVAASLHSAHRTLRRQIEEVPLYD
jgi:RNA polymerase sigma-70 factor (ECF subfamily)